MRREILRGSLAPGAPIKERVLAERMQVSRTPMREAIRILAKEGLVILRPARSPVVADPPMQEIADSIEVLSLLELRSGELACANATSAEIAGIRALNDRFAAAYDHTDMLDLFEIDMGFHRAIAHASHNPVLAEIYEALLARLWRARYLSARQRRNRDRVLRQHCAIVEGLERRDVDQVRREIAAHLQGLMDNIVAHIAGEVAAEDPPPGGPRPEPA
ncbi:GntR family transcriptional regulator [Paralimibaculum aggregatum]|uniref:GntR family transcriptional regulator n=2 Tax=Paralimibaculum aggregatum TaxID=3036245 RepID=A0ABQ6LRU9_9RHOB|nr:GntR family transcriptional regulator [Limibaculum sp. NKW23]